MKKVIVRSSSTSTYFEYTEQDYYSAPKLAATM